MKAIVIYSGGMDSYTVLHKAIAENDEVMALSFNYGQKHSKELIYAAKVCQELSVKHKIISLDFMADLGHNSSLLNPNKSIPEGHYEAESMKSTVVPNRNMIMLSIAYGYAISNDFDSVYYGAHSGDHHIYPDCRPEFVQVMQNIGSFIDDRDIDLKVPFLYGDKVSILKAGYEMGLDYSKTWTCYVGGEKPCGKCGSCQERAEAFATLNLEDPLLNTANE